MLTYSPQSESEMLELGHTIAPSLTPSTIVTLTGTLGAGKTTLVRGILQALGVTHTITSPTFTLINEYPCATQDITRIAHIDTYRLESEADLLAIGITDYLNDPHTLTLIEWPEKITSLLEGRSFVAITIDHTETGRIVTIKSIAAS